MARDRHARVALGDAVLRLPRRAGAPRAAAVSAARRWRTSRARLMRTVGPWLREHRIGRANLAAAFPEKSAAEIEQILAASGTISAASAPSSPISTGCGISDRAPGRAASCESAESERIVDAAARRRQAGADLRGASGELGAAGGRRPRSYGSTPRCSTAGPTSGRFRRGHRRAAPAAWARWCRPAWRRRSALAEALQRGSHVAMLVDQYYGARRAGDVLRPPHHGQPADRAARAPDRLPDPRHPRGALSGRPLPGRADRGDRPCRATPRARSTSQGTMQAITDVVEGWVREHPEQWLWLHRRWRDE